MVLERQNPASGKLKPRISNKERFHCVNPEINLSLYPALKNWLPCNHEYHICDYKTIRQTQDHVDFSATMRMSISTIEEVQQWVKDSTITWRIDRTRPPKGQRVIFKVDYRCHHNTKPRNTMEPSGRRTKNTNCPAKMSITLHRPQGSNGRQCRSTDPHMPGFPTLVHITNEHNHNLHVPDALRYKDVGPEAILKLKKLFEVGHTPSTALDVLKYDLQLELGEDYAYASADRSICPDIQFCYRLYHQVSKSMREASPSSSILPSQDTSPTWVAADPTGQTCIMEHEIVTTEISEVDNPTDKLKSCLSELCDYIEKQPSVWSATQDFINGIERLHHNPAKLASAMHAFGRYSCLLMKKRAKTMRRGFQCAGLAIATQPTAMRRKQKPGGRRRLTVGRQGNATSGLDHEYSQPEKRQRCSGSHGYSHGMSKTK
ncbi:hypothetical protein Q7C36_017465 [Tachysurus vachellii]|uniref:Uncharacterized protein n=1 Tax=Tachysurus vachellii TaxID=175792 RepID=A0AA88M4J4_TACVA|nr:uncharacterized protein si:dkey-75a21.2 [Tachysurus vachellii]KAK2829475.1 hypothetical protein Q7C36_017465 [Tachysurus vachellii]